MEFMKYRSLGPYVSKSVKMEIQADFYWLHELLMKKMAMIIDKIYREDSNEMKGSMQ